MNPNFNIKKILILILILVVVILCSWVYFQSTKVYEFAGNLNKIENGIVFIEGRFLKNNKPIVGKENEIISLQIKTDNNTQIMRLALNIPQGTGVFNIKDLKQEESAVSLAIIEKDFIQTQSVGVESLLKKGIFDTNYTAKSLYFRVPVFSN